jgi:outer membrane protein insertion porin family
VMADHINLAVGADMVTKSTGYSGPVVTVGLSHGNTFKGAEKVSLELKGGFEWQWGEKEEYQLGTISYEFGVNAGITFPKLLLPGNRSGIKTLKVQETGINQSFNVLNRTAYYSMFSSSTNIKYNWSNTKEILHSFSPVYINSVNVLATTPAFDSVINENIYIRKSFEEQFIVGMKYDFSYDNTHKSQLQNIYFQTGISTSGNLLDLFAGMGKEPSERPFKFLNSIYSQYVKLTTDFRYYLNGFNKTLAMRLYAGVGIPYLNSSVLPYVEQFFSGGAYSIRGFTARTVGPGSFHEQNSTYIDQSGDLKLEANLEYRFGISETLKGALFVETGNIWLINEDENRPGSKFDINTFHTQLAVGAGVGLRFDFNFFVLRTDFGVPIRTPYLQESGKNWLSGNRVLSEGLFYLAIGYPF